VVLLLLLLILTLFPVLFQLLVLLFYKLLQPGQRFHVEYNRLKSFEGASVSMGAEHLNDTFAEAGKKTPISRIDFGWLF
jgi:hypothetical protein